MKLLTNFAVYEGCLDEYEGPEDLARECRDLGLDGLEVVWGEEDEISMQPPSDLITGYHMLFFSTWVDFWQGSEAALLEEFGTWEAVCQCYGAENRRQLVERFRRDLRRAIDLEAEYAVFHVSDVLMHECYTYSFSHTDSQVCDCACDLVNQILDGMDTGIMLLLENQWWPGFTFCDPAMTQRLIDGIEYENVGIMLDTGHLMNANTSLRTQAQAARYIMDCYDAHGPLRERVYGLHLHQSLSGEYVEKTRGIIPADFKGSYTERFATSYGHVLSIDRHDPWTDPVVADLVRHINPAWVNNELSGGCRAKKAERLRTQLRALS